MAVRWRDLLDHLRIPWSDRHHSTHGWIALQCPWCGSSDPSMHLGIHEGTGRYHCLRTTGHGGQSPYYLLKSLGAAGNLDDLLEIYGGVTKERFPERKPSPPTSLFTRRWSSFQFAAVDPEACDYLAARGFWRPTVTAREFDLRVGTGRWAARLWFPLTYGGEIVGFTGRAMRNQQPRYMTETSNACLYMPRAAPRRDKSLIIVEGPIDALRLADFVWDRYDIFTVALCGLTITESKRLQLLALARLIPQFFVVLDSTVLPVQVNQLLAELRMCLSDAAAQPVLRRLDLPPGVDDPGDMHGGEIQKWLKGIGLAGV